MPRVNTKPQLELNTSGETNLEDMKGDCFSDVSDDNLELITIGEENSDRMKVDSGKISRLDVSSDAHMIVPGGSMEGMKAGSGSASGLHVMSSDAYLIAPGDSDLGVVTSGSALEDDRLSLGGGAMDLDDPEWTPTGLKQETKGPGRDGSLMSQTEVDDCK